MNKEASRGAASGRILLATAIAGTLDIGMAAIETALKGRPVTGMLRSVASGPFPSARDWATGGAVLGLVVHFAIMAVIASVFIIARDRIAWARLHTLVAAAIYGVLVWLVMYGLVLPLRFGVPFPSQDPVEIAEQLFAHVVLVGLSIGVVARSGSTVRYG